MKILLSLLLLFSLISAENSYFSLEYKGDSSVTTDQDYKSLYGYFTNKTDDLIYINFIKEVKHENFDEVVVCINGKCYMPTVDTAMVRLPADSTVEVKVNVDCDSKTTGDVLVAIERLEKTPIAGTDPVQYEYVPQPEIETLNYSFTFSTDNSSAIEDIEVISDKLELSTYPNPFNPTTNISFNMPTAEKISLKVYDVKGKHITTLVDGNMSQGSHVATFNGSHLPSGVYFAKFKSGSAVKTQKMVLVK